MTKKSIFDRLNATNDVEMVDSTSNPEQVVKIVGLRGTEQPKQLSSSISSSIFNRLGNKKLSDIEIEKKSIAFAGILKNSPTKKTVSRK
jgi:hypothetical protein